jgi:hypothetical protein
MSVTAAQAALKATAYISAIDAQVDIYRKWHPDLVVPFVNTHIKAALGTEDAKVSSEHMMLLSRLKPRDQASVQFAGQDAATSALWKKHKIVYHVDYDLWETMGDVKEETFIPEGTFGYLPHPDPFIAFPEPLIMPINEDSYQKVDGFFVTGRVPGIDGKMQRSTMHPATTELGLLIMGPVFKADSSPLMLDSKVQDMIFTRATVRAGTTVADINRTVGTNFLGLADDDHWEEHVPTMVRRAASLLIYLCATNVDLTPIPAPPVAKRGPAKGEKRPRVVGVGYKVGAQLRAYKKQAQAESKATGRQVSPHIRRAHLHTFRCGPGRTETRVKWLSPILVKGTGQDADLPTTIGVK